MKKFIEIFVPLAAIVAVLFLGVNLVIYLEGTKQSNTQEPAIFNPKGLALIGYPEGNVCSAVVVSDKYALTAAHCVEDCRRIHPFLPPKCKRAPAGMALTSANEGVIRIVPVKVHRVGPLDYAVLVGDFRKLDKAPLDSVYQYDLKDGLITCGYAAPSSIPTCLAGEITNFSGMYIKDRTSLISKGMSGGPVYNEQGFVIGVNSGQDGNGAIYTPIRGVDGYMQ